MNEATKPPYVLATMSCYSRYVFVRLFLPHFGPAHLHPLAERIPTVGERPPCDQRQGFCAHYDGSLSSRLLFSPPPPSTSPYLSVSRSPLLPSLCQASTAHSQQRKSLPASPAHVKAPAKSTPAGVTSRNQTST